MGDVLFLSHRIPYPPDKGDKIRAWAMLDHLARSHRVHLGCFVDDPEDMQHEAFLRKLCASVACIPLDRRRQKLLALARLRPGKPLTMGFYHSATLQRWVRDTLAREDVALQFLFCSAMAPYARPGISTVLDMVDVDSEKWTEYASRARFPAKLVWAREGRTLLRAEAAAAAAFDRTLFVSDAECARFATLAPGVADRLDWVENGVNLAYFSPEHRFETPFTETGPQIVFTGTMDYWPNEDAVTWFATSILPLLRHIQTEARFTIVGANPTASVLALGQLPGVTVTGRVPDVRPFVAHAAAIVAPLRIARGIQNKVLEAMAMGRPVVATPQAHEGIRAGAGEAILVADTEAGLAGCLAAVLDGAHAGLGGAARAAMERGYSWTATLSRLDTILDNIPAPSRPLAAA